MTERVVAIDHPIGHAHHIPVEPNCFERIIARTTLNMRSVNVVIINLLMRWNLSRGFSAKHNVSENSVQNICRAVSPQRMRIIGSMVFFYL